MSLEGFFDEAFAEDFDALREEISTVMAEVPELTAFGLRLLSHPNYEIDRQALLSQDNVIAYDGASFWVNKLLDKRKTINKNYNSYNMKHMCERFLDGYIPNGTLIAAMINQGYDWAQCVGPIGYNPNVMFNVSFKDYHKKEATIDVGKLELEAIQNLFEIDYDFYLDK